MAPFCRLCCVSQSTDLIQCGSHRNDNPPWCVRPPGRFLGWGRCSPLIFRSFAAMPLTSMTQVACNSGHQYFIATGRQGVGGWTDQMAMSPPIGRLLPGASMHFYTGKFLPSLWLTCWLTAGDARKRRCSAARRCANLRDFRIVFVASYAQATILFLAGTGVVR